MSRLLVSTRKGLFVVDGAGSGAAVSRAAFVGDNVPLTFVDRRDGSWYAVLDHGHFGVKLHRSSDEGVTWTELAIPTYPPKPEGFVDKDMWGKDREWATKNIWALEAAPDSEGTLGGLVRLGESKMLGRLIGQAIEHARLCASDPLCAEHPL